MFFYSHKLLDDANKDVPSLPAPINTTESINLEI